MWFVMLAEKDFRAKKYLKNWAARHKNALIATELGGWKMNNEWTIEQIPELAGFLEIAELQSDDKVIHCSFWSSELSTNKEYNLRIRLSCVRTKNGIPICYKHEEICKEGYRGGKVRYNESCYFPDVKNDKYWFQNMMICIKQYAQHQNLTFVVIDTKGEEFIYENYQNNSAN
jgi:hypothetical protein